MRLPSAWADNERLLPRIVDGSPHNPPAHTAAECMAASKQSVGIRCIRTGRVAANKPSEGWVDAMVDDKGESHASQMRLLLRLQDVQASMLASLTAANARRMAGDLPGARDAYQSHISQARQFLVGTLAFNEHTESPFETEPLAESLTHVLLVQADIVEALGEHAAAEPLRREAADLAARFFGESATADFRRQQGATLAAAGRFHEALIALGQAREMFTVQGDILGAAQTNLEYAALLGWLGDHARALEAVHCAAELVESRLSGDGKPSLLDIGRSLVSDLIRIRSGKGNSGRTEEQLALWRISTEIREHEARVRKETGNLDEAERLFQDVAPRYRTLGSVAAIDFQLAAIDVRRGRSNEALRTLEAIAPTFEQEMFRPRRGALMTLLADVYLGIGRPADALSYVSAGMEDQERYPDLDTEWKLQWRRARALEMSGRAQDALRAYLDAARGIDELRKAPLGYRLDSTYLDNKLAVFDSAIDLAVRVDAPNEGCLLIELVKARALTATLSVPSARRPAIDSLELEFDEVSNQLDALEYATFAGRATRELRREHKDLLVKRARLAERIRIADPRWRALSAPVPFDVDALLGALQDRDQAVLTLYDRPGEVVAVLLYAGSVRIGRKAVAEDIRRSIETYMANLLKREPDPYMYDVSEEFGVTAEMLLPAPLLESALAATSLVVVPHQQLHLVPWAGLTAGGARLFEYTAIGVLPNASCLTLLGGDFASTPRAALFGAPDYTGLHLLYLPDARGELNDLAKLYGDRLLAAPVMGSDATEGAFWCTANLGEPGALLHVACHGKFDAVEPLSSGLLVTGSKVDAGEISLRRLSFDEVVLSACYTGWRPHRVADVALRGDDVIGLTAALLDAGARFVLVSIPKAEDPVARKFMLRFHEARLKGATPLTAVRDTQRALLSDGEFQPFQWLGFTAYGCR